MLMLAIYNRSFPGGLHFQTHPVAGRRDRNWIVPLFLHGDGTPCMGVGKAWGVMMDFWHWGSMVAWSGHSELVNMLIYCVQAPLRSKATLDRVFKRMSWSFDALQAGEWPEFDWNNGRIDYSGRMGQATRFVSRSIKGNVLESVRALVSTPSCI